MAIHFWDLDKQPVQGYGQSHMLVVIYKKWCKIDMRDTGIKSEIFPIPPILFHETSLDSSRTVFLPKTKVSQHVVESFQHSSECGRWTDRMSTVYTTLADNVTLLKTELLITVACWYSKMLNLQIIKYFYKMLLVYCFNTANTQRTTNCF